MKRDGRWLVPQRMEVRVTGGSVTLDFTEAVIVQPSLLIDADVSASRLTLVTKPGNEHSPSRPRMMVARQPVTERRRAAVPTGAKSHLMHFVRGVLGLRLCRA